MGIRTLIFLGLFVLCGVGALFSPVLGVYGYAAHYMLGPERQWWSAPLRPYGIRYSFILAGATAIGFLLHCRTQRFGRRWFVSQEWMLATFLALVWLVSLISPGIQGYTSIDHPAMKLSKVLAFCFLLTHTVTTTKRLQSLSLVMIVGSLMLGVQAYFAPRWMFQSGRLEAIGGTDFAEANFLPAFLGGVLPVTGVYFLRPGYWPKALSLVSGAFAVNAIVLTRSRGAFLALLAGAVAALALCPRRLRNVVTLGMAVAAVGALSLFDAGFSNRLSTISHSESDMDESSLQRLETWEATWDMVLAHPLGVGPGNFSQSIGHYNAKYYGRDAHSTLARCLGELGFVGFLLLVALVFNSLRISYRTIRRLEAFDDPAARELMLLSFSFAAGTVITMSCGLLVTLLYTEMLWWMLCISVCLERAADNLLEERFGDDHASLCDNNYEPLPA